MKAKKMILWSASLILIGAQALAGMDGKGNGGGAIVCTDSDGKIISAKLLDLREAEKPENESDRLEMIRSEQPVDEQLEAALAKLSSYSPYLVSQMRAVLKKMKIESSSERLPPPTDTRIKILREPRNCHLEGVADYDDQTDTLKVDPTILKAMSQTDVAALYFHEALYKTQRVGTARVQSSLNARKLTGIVFSTESLKITPVHDGVEDAKFVCSSADSNLRFYIFDPKEGKIRVQFTRLPQTELVEKTYYDFDETLEISTNLKQGLIKNERPIAKSDPQAIQEVANMSFFKRMKKGDDAWWDMRAITRNHTFSTVSTYGPSYTLYLQATDELRPNNAFRFSKIHYVENSFLRFVLQDVVGFNGDQLSCEKL